MWAEEMFKVKKPIIAMLHLDPLPGDPMWKYGMNMQEVVENARRDLIALQEGGVDGIIFSNEFSSVAFSFPAMGSAFWLFLFFCDKLLPQLLQNFEPFWFAVPHTGQITCSLIAESPLFENEALTILYLC